MKQLLLQSRCLPPFTRAGKELEWPVRAAFVKPKRILNNQGKKDISTLGRTTAKCVSLKLLFTMPSKWFWKLVINELFKGDRVSLWGNGKSSGDGWRWWLHGKVNGLYCQWNAHLQTIKMVNVVLCIYYQFLTAACHRSLLCVSRIWQYQNLVW